MKAILFLILTTSLYAQSIRIVSVQVLDQGALQDTFAYQIDTSRNICTRDDGSTYNEKFNDTLVQLEVVNDTDKLIRFSDFEIYIKSFKGKKSFTASKRAMVGNLEIPAKSRGKIFGFMTKTSDDRKRLVMVKDFIPLELGVKNVEYRLFYKINKKKLGSISARSAAVFSQIDRCDPK